MFVRLAKIRQKGRGSSRLDEGQGNRMVGKDGIRGPLRSRAMSGQRWRFRTTAVSLVALLVALLVGCAASDAPAAPSATPLALTAAPTAIPTHQSNPSFRHVFVIVMENKEYDDIIGSPNAPYLNHLAATYGLATEYFANYHPSLPNYLELISGANQGITDDCGTCSVDAPNLVDQLEAHGKTWRAYMEDLPSPCFNGPSAGGPLAVVGRG